ncbi:D-glycerate dehydrogenase [Candidatus Kaiserbacteria bacterium]|nr:D-glycerate dehydrogenase [Candidatus Kaiserbacteria bacterium]USN92305.1 MAG: D-glycerate dehydrogenase [Candidatus Nomurabacteria bacterium]
MALIFVTRKIPEIGLRWMKEGGHEVVVSEKDGALSPDELKEMLSLRPYEGIVSLLTDHIDGSVLSFTPQLKIVANYAVGFNNIDVSALGQARVTVTNTPDVLTDTVAEYTVSLILSVVKRIPEADRFMRAKKYQGWSPELLLGSDLTGKTLGIVGAGRIGSAVAKRLSLGFGMQVNYYDINRSESLESEIGCHYYETPEDVLRTSDVVSLHVPLLPETKHFLSAERLAMMKPSAYLINTSRGGVIDEKALVEALKKGIIKGAGLDVFESEPKLARGLSKLENVVLTPHIASASEETRNKMSEMVAVNINEFFLGHIPPNIVSFQ